MMADKYVVAVDESKFAEDAFECESSHVFIRIGSHNEQNEPINVKRWREQKHVHGCSLPEICQNRKKLG